MSWHSYDNLPSGLHANEVMSAETSASHTLVPDILQSDILEAARPRPCEEKVATRSMIGLQASWCSVEEPGIGIVASEVKCIVES